MLRLGDIRNVGPFGTDRRISSSQDFEDSRPLLAKRSRREEQLSFVPDDGSQHGGNLSGGFMSSQGLQDSINPPKNGAMKIPDLIQSLAVEGQCIRWDQNSMCYEVLNGQLFEQKFNALRSVRGKRKEDAVDRPFARMHTYFVLIRGEKWAGTGSLFRPKNINLNQPLCSDRSDLASSCTSSNLGTPDNEDGHHHFQIPVSSGTTIQSMQDITIPQQPEEYERDEDFLFLSPMGMRDNTATSQVALMANLIEIDSFLTLAAFPGPRLFLARARP